MTTIEASKLLGIARWVMFDMGMVAEALQAEEAAFRVLRWEPGQAHAYADHVLPKGKRGRVVLVLRRPEEARALAFVAAVLRDIR